MDEIIQRDLLSTIKDAWVPPYSGSIYKWAYENVVLPSQYAITGRFDVSISRYLIEPFDALLNDSIRQVNCISAIQTFKSGIGEIWLPYIITNDGGQVMRLHQSDDMAQTFVETRLIPLLNSCEKVKKLLDTSRFTAKKQAINLPHMSVKISGPKENVIAGLTIKYLIPNLIIKYIFSFISSKIYLSLFRKIYITGLCENPQILPKTY